MNGFELPLSWQLVSIGELCAPVETNVPERRGQGYFYYVDISSINNEQKTIASAKRVPNREAPSRARQVIATNDVLVSTVRPNLNAVAIVPENLDGEICSTGFCVLRAKQEILDHEFLFTWVRHPDFVKALVRLEQGIGYPAVRDKDIQQTSIPLPPLPEQKRILAILREADELRRLRQQANEKAKDLLPALFQEMFGEVDDSWEDSKLKDVIQKLSPGKSFAAASHQAREGKIGILKVSAVTQGVFKPEENKELPENLYFPSSHEVKDGDLLISRANTKELVGASAIVRNPPKGLLRSDKLWKVVLHKQPKINLSFLYVILNTPKLRREISNRATGTSSSMRNISQDKFLDIQVKLPPKPLQDKFEERVRLLWEQIDAQNTASEKLDNLFQSLLAQAFTGELSAAWREQHQVELAEAAGERDRLLQITQPTITEPADEDAISPKPPEQQRDRDELFRTLSETQRKIYQLVIQETAYFTPERLEEKYDIPRNIGKLGLQLLAATGLIVSVTLPTATSSGLRYELAYRNLNPDDDTRYSDLALLTKD